MSSIPRGLQSATWDHFTLHLPHFFGRFPEVVKEAIMTDINDLMQEFWRTSSDEVDRATFFAVRRLLRILQQSFVCDISEVCFDIFPLLRLPST